MLGYVVAVLPSNPPSPPRPWKCDIRSAKLRQFRVVRAALRQNVRVYVCVCARVRVYVTLLVCWSSRYMLVVYTIKRCRDPLRSSSKERSEEKRRNENTLLPVLTSTKKDRNDQPDMTEARRVRVFRGHIHTNGVCDERPLLFFSFFFCLFTCLLSRSAPSLNARSAVLLDSIFLSFSFSVFSID